MLLDKFVRKVAVTTNKDECWNWLGPITANGYGRFCVRTKSFLAHRWVYEEVVDVIPPGFVLDHLCRNRLCVNPMHLDLVEHKENARRAGLNDVFCRNGHKREESNVYVVPSTGARTCLECRDIYNVKRRKYRYAKF